MKNAEQNPEPLFEMFVILKTIKQGKPLNVYHGTFDACERYREMIQAAYGDDYVKAWLQDDDQVIHVIFD